MAASGIISAQTHKSRCVLSEIRKQDKKIAQSSCGSVHWFNEGFQSKNRSWKDVPNPGAKEPMPSQKYPSFSRNTLPHTEVSRTSSNDCLPSPDSDAV